MLYAERDVGSGPTMPPCGQKQQLETHSLFSQTCVTPSQILVPHKDFQRIVLSTMGTF